jgi:hypothetical protein
MQRLQAFQLLSWIAPLQTPYWGWRSLRSCYGEVSTLPHIFARLKDQSNGSALHSTSVPRGGHVDSMNVYAPFTVEVFVGLIYESNYMQGGDLSSEK